MKKMFNVLLGIISGIILGIAIVCVLERIPLDKIWQWVKYRYFFSQILLEIRDLPMWQSMLIFGISILWGIQGASRTNSTVKVVFYPIVMLIKLLFGIIKLVLGIALMIFVFGALVLIFDALGILHIALGFVIGFGLLWLLCIVLDNGCDAILVIFE